MESAVALPPAQGVARARTWLGLGFRARILLGLVVAVVLTAVLVGGLGYWRFQTTLQQELKDKLGSYTSTVAAGLVLQPDAVQPNPQILAALPEWGTTRFRVSKAGRVYLEGGRYPDNLSGWLSTRRDLEHGFLLEVALDVRDQQQALKAFLSTELLALPLSLGIAFITSFLLLGYLMRPIRKLTEATHALAQQRFPEPLAVPSGNDEISDLAQSFNRMTQAVRGFLERERSFARYTSHELRTPLATLRVQIEALEQGLLPSQQAIPAIKASLTRLERILVGLLALTRSPQTNPAPIPLEEVLRAVLFHLPPEQRGRVELGGNLEAAVQGYEELVHQALGNLISNALKFSHDPVTVNVTQSGQWVSIAVQDSGPGVPEALLERLGEPFFRLQNAVEGLGLGLALVRHVATLLGGSLTFENAGGLLATLTLPRAEVQ